MAYCSWRISGKSASGSNGAIRSLARHTISLNVCSCLSLCACALRTTLTVHARYADALVSLSVLLQFLRRWRKSEKGSGYSFSCQANERSARTQFKTVLLQ